MAEAQEAHNEQGNGGLSRSNTGQRLRAACDECRSKKLRCTREQPTCARCEREGIVCVYSAQKQMGRPKKRARVDGDGKDEQGDVSTMSEQVFVPFGGSQSFPDLDAKDGSEVYVVYEAGQWPEEDMSVPIPLEAQVPSLTSNSSSDSPPTSNLATNPSHPWLTSQPRNEQSPPLDFLDPSLSAGMGDLGDHASIFPQCACLSTMYLALNNLTQINSDFDFPYSLHPLREALETIATVLACDECPKRFITALQNTQLVGTLIISVAERFGKVLEVISTECLRAEISGEEKRFRLADLNTAKSHLHAGGLGCVAAFSVTLSPSEWRSMAKKVVRAEVYGPSDGNNCCQYLMGVIKQMEARQEHAHTHDMPADFPRDAAGVPLGGPHLPKEDHLCLRLCNVARKIVVGFDWT